LRTVGLGTDLASRQPRELSGVSVPKTQIRAVADRGAGSGASHSRQL
jgi:hypothetical protein